MTMQKVWLFVRSLLWVTLFLLLQMWYLPQWLGLRGSWNVVEREPFRWLGVLPLLLGTIIVIPCFFRFGSEGHGAPAPFDSPRKLVVQGLYRRVRNPMYYGLAFLLIGEAVLFGEFQVGLVYYALGLGMVVHLFVVLYEEPTLHRKFGDEYKEYCSKVPRWFGWRVKM